MRDNIILKILKYIEEQRNNSNANYNNTYVHIPIFSDTNRENINV